MILPHKYNRQGFTLIELSIVLVIIGLIVGGVLVGQDLINAAGIRAQISQIEKYQAAVNTFRGKYGYLPGDMPDPYASQYGFTPRPTLIYGTSGDGIITGGGGTTGETGLFWVDLNKANLISGNFSLASPITPPGVGITGALIASYMPPAKLGGNNYVYVWSGGAIPASLIQSPNYFGISTATILGTYVGMDATSSMMVSQAYNIDKKIDDGLPTTGRVQALFLDGGTFDNGVGWAGNGDDYLPPFAETNPLTGSATTCFDNGGSGGFPHYSMQFNNGSGQNCALSFQFQ
jgi:prepilin-type N-terminal cleavage/methylation domain-containing protein